jgi:lipopolysaccharide transport system permease protein
VARAEIVERPAAPYDEEPVRREPVRSRIRLRELRSYLPMVRVLAIRDLKAKYKQSVLGPVWVVFQPVALLGAFAVGFREVAHVDTGAVPYGVFVLPALAVWAYFQATIMMCTGSVVNAYALVRWTACPRLALPLASLAANLPSFAIPAIPAIVAAAASGLLSVRVLLLPLCVVWMFLFVAVCGALLAAVAVRARDVLSAVPFLLQVTLFLSPVGYPTSSLSGALHTLISLNPLTGLIDAWRWVILGVPVNVLPVTASLVLTGLLTVIAWCVFARLEVSMADYI